MNLSDLHLAADGRGRRHLLVQLHGAPLLKNEARLEDSLRLLVLIRVPNRQMLVRHHVDVRGVVVL